MRDGVSLMRVTKRDSSSLGMHWSDACRGGGGGGAKLLVAVSSSRARILSTQ